MVCSIAHEKERRVNEKCRIFKEKTTRQPTLSCFCRVDFIKKQLSVPCGVVFSQYLQGFAPYSAFKFEGSRER